MKKYASPIVTLVIISSLSVYFYLAQKEINEQIKNLINRDEIVLKKLIIANKFGDRIIELSENENFSGSMFLYNKSKNKTIVVNAGNKDENPGIIISKGENGVSFALMGMDKQNLFVIYNENGLDVVRIGTDKEGHGGYSIKNVHERVIKTEGWGWRAYNY
ncbi:MAG TPA: hypothetical protein ENH82_07665 [bacterium]|nr:hypothetical protein [bacterium]